jgi:hypothetical protein
LRALGWDASSRQRVGIHNRWAAADAVMAAAVRALPAGPRSEGAARTHAAAAEVGEANQSNPIPLNHLGGF